MALAETVLPQGGSVIKGNVTISTPGAGRMVLNQGSDRAIVNWDGFSIGRGGSVDIRQPDTSSAILNRVTGDTTSQIHGRLTATGQVFVVNPNGLFIGPQGEVRAQGGFVGSTLDTNDDDFMAGRLRFDGVGSSAAVDNAGRIIIGRGGFAALLGGRVSNSGLVMVPMGRIGFGAGERTTLDLSGDRFLQVEIPSEGGDEMRALIEHSGTVSADGGLIEMQAATARHAARHAINLSGVAEARSVSVSNGTITLGGGAGGRVTVSGRATTRAKKQRRPAIIVAQSRRPAARPGGGDVTITGRDISLIGAKIDASGGGGIVRIGGDYQGGDTLPTALYLGVDVDTTITADAGARGDAGRVILWSDTWTEFAGTISARGGTSAGDGGFVEVSGKQTLAFSGMVDTSAPHGAFGTLLLDPYNVTIDDVPTSGGTLTATDLTPNADNSTLSVTQLEDNLGRNNVTVSTGSATVGAQNGDITVASQIDWTAPTVLALQAAGDVRFDAGVDADAGGLQIDAGGAITTGPAGSVNVGTFELLRGDWAQLGAALPAFDATDFQVAQNTDTGFLRALGGTGTAADPYLLTDIYGVQGLRTQALLNQSFALANDIEASGTENWNSGDGFAAIDGLSGSAFGGTFDGQENAINNLASNDFDAALFARTDGADIQDLTLGNVLIGGSNISAALIGTAIDTTIENVTATGIVANEFGTIAGGLVGDMRGAGGTLNNSRFEGRVSAENESDTDLIVGGLVGRSFLSTLSNSTFTGQVLETGTTIGQRHVGGAVGINGGAVDTVTTSGTVAADGSGGPLYIGGLTGENTSIEGITNATSAMALSVESALEDAVYAGGLAGYNIGSITGSDATGNLSIAAAGSDLRIGGLIGFNENSAVRPVTDVTASGSIDVSNEALVEGVRTTEAGGLVGVNFGPISGATASGNLTVSSALVNSFVGGFVGTNGRGSDSGGPGEISEAAATGAASYATDLEGVVGGFAARNEGTITDAFASGDASLSMLAFNGSTSGANYASSVGGFTGLNSDTQTRTAARGSASGQTLSVPVAVGGHTGTQFSGTTRDSYASGDVSASSFARKFVGGLIGALGGGTVLNTYSNGIVSNEGEGVATVGGLIGQNAEATVTASYWDVDTAGQADTGDASLGEGLSTVEFEDTEGFFTRAEAAGWDFANVWAPGAINRYPSIYTIDRVVFATPGALVLTYGQTTTAVARGTVSGGPGIYVFADAGETLDTTPLFETPTFVDNTVGTQIFTLDTTPLTSSTLRDYAVVAREGSAEITPAPLQLTVNDAAKTYGSALAFDGTEFA
ncbi:filamentous hemagglutinin N-terminal domain-containing protein, partial [uncultured Sulfitobacter sp.]|uniref:beta strand repeat-containing protein n=1 Tax=uncultured Sulfitobacter sp. TaxID=191468 RepID=UPI002606F7A6